MPYEELYDKMLSEYPENINSAEILQNIIEEYPYFSPAHFFLLKETASSQSDYKKIAAKTALHFNNPFFLNYQLHKKATPTLIPEEKESFKKGINIPVEVEKENTIIEDPKPIEKNKEPFLFEPLHTTDYFASQGIKLGEEIQTGDKLGKQLKSFTDWLKTMKKVHDGKLPIENPNMDIAVQQLAEKSNKEQEVLTESMAEVYVQQGKTGKAQDIYEKLSLLNPAKSAYFAAKIESLKEK